MNSERRVQLAAQADLVLLTAEMLRPPPTGFGSTGDWWQDRLADWLNCLTAAGLPASTSKDGTTLTAALSEVFGLARQVQRSDWSDEYWRLFDGPTACPANQAAYDRRDKGTILGDLSGFYRGFGWDRVAESGERPDHLRCQLEFVAVLLTLASQAQTSEQEEVVADGLMKFARIHLHDWLPSFGWHLCEVTILPMFGAIATWIVMLWDGLTEFHQWPADGRSVVRTEPQLEPENPYECAANGLVQIGEH